MDKWKREHTPIEKLTGEDYLIEVRRHGAEAVRGAEEAKNQAQKALESFRESRTNGRTPPADTHVEQIGDEPTNGRTR